VYWSHGYLLCRARIEAIDPTRNDAALATEASPCRPGILIASGSYRRLGRLKLDEQVHIVRGIVEALCRALWQRPAPDVYLLALERLGIAGEAALAFEDSAVGLASARCRTEGRRLPEPLHERQRLRQRLAAHPEP
jgi:beta-phosphoglucomutase-like phosphatase (HAD superfamily)